MTETIPTLKIFKAVEQKPVRKELLLTERVLVVYPALACEYGLQEAILLQQMTFLMDLPKFGKVIDGDKWIHMSAEDWLVNFPFWKDDTIYRLLTKLEAIGAIKSSFQSGYDRTKSYTICYAESEASPIPQKRDMDSAKTRHGSRENAESLSNTINTDISFTPPAEASAKKPPPKSRSAPKPTKTGRNKADLDAMYESIMTTLYQVAPTDDKLRKAKGSMVGKFRKALLDIAPDVPARRVARFCEWLSGKSEYMKNLMDSAKLQSYFGDFGKEQPPRVWTEGKVYDDHEYRQLKRPQFRKFEGGKWWMRSTMFNDSVWEIDADPIID